MMAITTEFDKGKAWTGASLHWSHFYVTDRPRMHEAVPTANVAKASVGATRTGVQTQLIQGRGGDATRLRRQMARGGRRDVVQTPDGGRGGVTEMLAHLGGGQIASYYWQILTVRKGA